MRIKYTVKTLTRYNFNANPLEAAEFFRKMRHVPAASVINFDATNTASGVSLKERLGRSEAGYPAIQVEFIIKNKPWCVVAAYSPNGFLCWRFFQGTGVRSEDICKFLDVDLRPFVGPDTIIICDNASNQKSQTTIDTLEDVSRGRYQFTAPYWHIYSPVERGFSNVLREVRLHEDKAMFNPVTELDKAFFKYSAAGPMGHVAQGHFSCYAKNHQDWLDEIQEELERERAFGLYT